MTVIDSATPSALTPPSDPADVDQWLGEREAEIAEVVRAEMLRIVNTAIDRYVASLTAAGDPAAFDGMQGDWTKFVNNDLGDRVGGMYLSGALAAFVQNPAAQTIPGPYQATWASAMNVNATQYLSTATNRIVGAGPETWNHVRSLVTDSIDRGTSNEKLKDTIQQATGYTEFRSDTIGRTETVGAYNAGDYDGAVQLGEYGPVEKSWLAANDARTRPSHQAADGQTVPFAEPFDVGGVRMMRPHDVGAPAGEVVNCRCVLQLLYPGDTRPDGTVIEDTKPEPEWQPGPVVNEAGDEIDPATLRRAPEQPSLGGAHPKTVLVDTNGNQYLFKPQEEWVAQGEAAASQIAIRGGLDVPRVTVMRFDGQVGSVQPMLSGARKPFGPGSPHDFDPTKLSAADVHVMQQHRVFDWLVGNHDAHAGQFVRVGYANTGTSRLVGIDKGQAFKYFDNDKLDVKYHPNGKYGEAMPVHNIIEDAWATNRIGDDAFMKAYNKNGNALTDTIGKLSAIPDAEYRAMLRPYAQGRYATAEAVDEFLDLAVARKNALADDLRKYHYRLLAQRKKVRKALQPTPPPAVPGSGGLKGMSGAKPSINSNDFMDAVDHPVYSRQQYPRLVDYTGGTYTPLNKSLRFGTDEYKHYVDEMRTAMKPLKDDIVVYRGTNLLGGWRGPQLVPDDITTLQGSVFHDRAFLSTSAGSKGPAMSGDTAFIIRANAGTRGTYVENVSNVKGEREFILRDGSNMYVHVVRRADPKRHRWEENYQWIIEAEVVDDDWIRNAGLRTWDSNRQAWIGDVGNASSL